jgi:DNA polymerase (family X)
MPGASPQVGHGRPPSAHHHRDSSLDGSELRQVPNVGASIANKITEYFQTGSFKALEELRDKIPARRAALMEIPTLGPKRP